MANIQLISTGGTIASRSARTGADVLAAMSGEDLRKTLDDPLEGIDLAVDEFCRIGSSAMDLPLSFAIAQRIAFHLHRDDCDGVVVTHGTDTMEESAFLAELVLSGDKPVVFTGAQKSADDRDTDGPRNLANAVRLAADRKAAGLGVTIAFEGDIHAARDVTKTHTSRTDTFRSGGYGKLGEIDGTHISIHRRPAIRRSYPVSRIEPAVELLRMSMGCGDRLLRFAATGDTRAIVIEGFGRGNAPPAITGAVAEIVSSGIPVIVTSRCPEGRVKPIYGNGGGRDLERAGALFAGDLSGQKMRILAAVVLGLDDGRARLPEEIAFFGG